MPELKKKKKLNLSKFRESTGSVSFAESKYGKISGWLDTGCYALNRILSGNVHDGIAYGKITLFAGDSQSGKSMIAANSIIDALKNKGFSHVFVIDAEGGSLCTYIADSGVDLADIDQILVDSAEDCQIKMTEVFNLIAGLQKEDPELQFLVILDSIGALIARKVTEDAGAGKVVADMGGTAKVIGQMIVSTTIPALRTNTPVIMLNHTYENPGDMMPSKLKSMKGGKKVLYMPRFSVQCSVTQRKADKMLGASDEDTFYQGNEFCFFCFKNGVVRPFFEARMLNNFIDPKAAKYYGLFDVAVGYGLVVRDGSHYKIPSYSADKKWYSKDIICGKESDQIWDALIPAINARSAVDMAFGSTSTNIPGFSEEAEQAAKEVKEVEEEMSSDSVEHISL